MKRLSLILILFILLSILLPACDGGDESMSDRQVTEISTVAETKDMSLIDELPQKNYEGYIYSMLSYPDNGDGHTDLDVSEITGDTLNDAIYNANRRVESRFGIKFNEMQITTWDQASKVLIKSVMAGEQLYDMAQMVDRDAMTLAMEGRYYYAMDELPYVDLDKAYYIQGANDTFSIGGTIYITYSAYMIGFYDCLHLMLYNKQLAENYNIDDIYTLIRNGKWTVDVLYGMAKTAFADLDGDGKMTDADQYGIAYHSMDYWCGFWAAEGIRLIDKDDDDLPYFNVPGNEKLFNLFDKLFEYSNVDYNFDLAVKSLKKYNTSEIPGHVRAIELFENGQALFTSSWIYNVQAYLRDMEADYGIVPFPVIDEKPVGAPYFGQSITAHVVVIPMTTSDVERASVIFEALNSEYANNVIPVYNDIVLNEKATRDEDSREMLQMMVNNCIIDLGETAWLSIGRSQYYMLFTKKANTFASFTASHEKTVNDALEKAIAAFNAVKTNEGA